MVPGRWIALATVASGGNPQDPAAAHAGQVEGCTTAFTRAAVDAM